MSATRIARLLRRVVFVPAPVAPLPARGDRPLARPAPRARAFGGEPGQPSLEAELARLDGLAA